MFAPCALKSCIAQTSLAVGVRFEAAAPTQLPSASVEAASGRGITWPVQTEAPNETHIQTCFSFKDISGDGTVLNYVYSHSLETTHTNVPRPRRRLSSRWKRRRAEVPLRRGQHA